MIKQWITAAVLTAALFAKGGMTDLDYSDFFEAPNKLTYQEAVDYCLNINARMLNIDELEAAYNSNLEEDFLKEYYWSGTPASDDYYGAYVFHFGLGIISSHHHLKKHHVMCVKKRRQKSTFDKY